MNITQDVISFGQAESYSSSDVPLHSDRFDNCHCIIALNCESGEAHMFHVWEAAHCGLSIDQQENAATFTEKPGKKIAVRVVGDHSYLYDPDGTAKQQLKDLGIEFADDIHVPSKDQMWEVLFHPQTREVEVAATDGTSLYQGIPFSQKSFSGTAKNRSRTGQSLTTLPSVTFTR